MRIADATRRLLRAYPRIFFACHQDHRRDPQSERKISAHQAQILDHLDEVDGTALTQLADHMGVTPSTMSLNVDRLERQALVERRRDDADRRRVLLFLTAAGARLKQAGSVLDPGRVAGLLRQLDPQQRRTGIEGLELLAAAAAGAMVEYRRERGRRREKLTLPGGRR